VNNRDGVLYLAGGFAGGLLVGLIVWSQQTRRYRRDLFSNRKLRRLAALGYLRGHNTTENVLLLRDYVNWEKHAKLKRRGLRILRRMEESLA
jgi:hypothetical protein